MSTHPRLLLVGATAIALVTGLVLGAGAVLAQGPAAPAKLPASSPAVMVGTALGAPLPNTGATGAGETTSSGPPTVTGGGAAVAGTAIYPYYGGTPGIAPDHTIVVTGTGQATLKSDGSNRAAAQKTALDAALADAKAQAETIASATGLSISGVLSVSASVSPYGVVMPMVAAPNAPVPAPTSESLGVSVTVAYRVG
jgi:Protein of unknown function (DUF541)